MSDSKKTRSNLDTRRNDMTLALSGADQVQKDKRFDEERPGDVKATERNWKEMQKHRSEE